MSASATDETSIADAGLPITAFHRDGQTFLTWLENEEVADERYHVYRHFEPITAANLNEAQKLTERWGPLDDETSRHKMAGPGVPDNFVISDRGEALADDIGLFVYTTQDNDSAQAWYAVTEVINGQEQISGVSERAMVFGVDESADDPSPVLVRSRNGGLSQIFTHFMDYSDWNPTFQGYAYNYAIALPTDYDASLSYPLKLELHAYYGAHEIPDSTEGNWPAIQLFVDDPGEPRGTLHTWWYGFAADHNYNTDGAIPTSGVIENFTEQRVLKAIDEVSQMFPVDEERIHARGNSMGASGALAFGVRYGQIFSGVFASQPMTDYETSPVFQSEFVQLWGRPEDNLTIRNEGIGSEIISDYGEGGSQPTGVWDWQDHGDQLIRRRGEEISLLMFGHGKEDRTIDWNTQGQPFVGKVNEAGVAYTAELIGGLDHTWIGFTFAPHTLVSGGSPDLGDWVFRSDEPYLAVSNASGSGDRNPGSSGTDSFNLNIDWSTASNPFGLPAIDQPDRFEISVRSLSESQTADLTPRRLNLFRPSIGEAVEFTNIDQNTGRIIQTGTLFVDQDGLLSINDFQLSNGNGNRLVLTTTRNAAPAQSPPPESPQPDNLPPEVTDPEVTDPAQMPLLDQPVPPAVRGASGSGFSNDVPAPDASVSGSSNSFVSGFGSVDSMVSTPPTTSSSPPSVDAAPVAPSSEPVAPNGTDGDDWVSGSRLENNINAGDGNDEIHVPAGENFVDGGPGLDTVTVYEGNRSDFEITRLSEDTVLLSGPGVDGKTVWNTLRNVEVINFNDAQVEVSSITDHQEEAQEQRLAEFPSGSEVVQGTDKDEWLSVGGQGTVFGNAGNDELHAPSGENTIDGGEGVDRFITYEGLRADFEVTRFQDGRITIDGPGVDGRPVRNTLLNVELIYFNDIVIDASTLPIRI